jgi:hypothetical protein
VADTEYALKDRVALAQDRDGVTEGTVGTVIQVSGLSWIRYRVRFDSGVERNLIDGRYLRPAPAAHRR